MILADPEVAIGLDVEEELSRQATPVVDLVVVVVLAPPGVNGRIEQRWRLYTAQEVGIHFLLGRNAKLPLADNNWIKPQSCLGKLPSAVVDDVLHLAVVRMRHGDIQNQLLVAGQMVVEISDRLKNFRSDVGIGQLIAADSVERDGDLGHAARKQFVVLRLGHRAVRCEFDVHSSRRSVVENLSEIFSNQWLSASRNAEISNTHLIQLVDDPFHTLGIQFLNLVFRDVAESAMQVADVRQREMSKVRSFAKNEIA